jgi:dTDP-glucose 4,6-dehydratase
VTRAVVTGGAGFLGSHLCERLLAEGWDVLCLDKLTTGDLRNLAGAERDPRFTFEERDVTKPIEVSGRVDWILHFASPASPVDYLERGIQTLKAGAIGTYHCLGLARATGASFVLASTSEVYGDPEVSPQPESYWGRVNPIGPRSVYDEAKRFAEAAAFAYHRSHGIPIRVGRIFNTYGERMRARDGRAVPTFLRQALAGEPITVHGEGSQTRSLCYVSDLIEGFWRLMAWDGTGPVNLGNPEEVTVRELAERIRDEVGSSSELAFVDRPEDDPERRCPDISLARAELGWEPKVPLDEGLARTVGWAREAWG